MNAEHMAYVGYCGDCGGMVAAVVDEPERPRDTAKDVGAFVRRGYRVERVTCQFVRDNLRGCATDCPCHHCVKRRGRKAKTARVEQVQQTELLASPPEPNPPQ